jgi:hypothetical protein
MKYLLMIHTDEAGFYTLPQPEQLKVMLAYRELREELIAKKLFLDGSRLHPVSSATIVRVRDGKRLVTDGPFAETREQLGGYFLVDVKDIDQAIAIAARMPGASMGAIEVRPLADPPTPPAAG